MKAVAYGPNDNLFGVLTEVESGTEATDIIAIAWNTGICGRMGPHRLNVEISSLLAGQGIASFRFDLGNLGDSLVGSQETDPIKKNQEELKFTLDMLEERFGYQKFLLIGICSSAVDAHHAAVADARVVGLMMVDSYVYPTKQFHLNYLKKRIFAPTSWKRFTQRKIKVMTGSQEEKSVTEGEDLFEGVYPDQEVAGTELQALVDRGVPLLVMYTGGFEHVYTYADQFRDMFTKVKFHSLLTLKHHPRADHLFTILEDRDQLLTDIHVWTDRYFTVNRHALSDELGTIISPEDGEGADLVECLEIDHLPALETKTWQNRSLVDILHEIDSNDATHVAIEANGVSYTYEYLKKLSHALAHVLGQKSVGRGSILGLCLDRSPALIASLIGVLRTGAAYLPLDPHYPRDRLRTMIELSQCKKILCHRRYVAMFESLGVELIIWEDIEHALETKLFASPQLTSHDAAYVIFTSGSTGQPKGVVLGHGALTQLLDWHIVRYPLAKPRTIQFTPISFDVSFQEIFSTLHSGGTLVLIEEELRLDPIALIDVLEASRIQRIFLPFVALQFIAEAAVSLSRNPKDLIEVFTAGEALKATPALRTFFNGGAAVLHNHYGPSETHVITAYELPRDPATWADLPPIGKAIDGSFVLLLDPVTMQDVPAGSEGELYLGGLSLAEGYIHRPDLTAERFIQHPHNPNVRLYKTGDIGRIDAQGEIEFLGRKDGQIKIRGHRIELGEIEVQLGNFPGIGQILVDPRTSKDQIYLVAYYRETLDLEALKEFVASKMPEAMRPSYYLKIDDFPLTPSGKIDRKALPSPFTSEAAKAPVPAISGLGLMTDLRNLWIEILPSSDFGDDQNFFDAGGTSLLAMRFVTLLKQRLELDLRIRDFFARPTLQGLLCHFNPQAETSPRPETRRPLDSNDPIAVIGMAVDIPSAQNLQSFWQMLLDGGTSLTRFAKKDLDPSLAHDLINDPNYVPVRGALEHPEAFDHEFFAISKREAELIDPQQRRLLQLCWSALEDAGQSAKAAGTRSGVFLGTAYNTYLLKQLMQNPKVLKRAGDFQVMLANDKDYVATRVAYKLDLRGPALSIHTACSTSLVATISAVQSLRRGECDVALAGAMSIQFPSRSGHIYQDGDIMSRDGHCRPFDAKASGTLFCDGGGVVALKRLADAIRDGDRIYSVIRGAAWNNDGREKASFSAPGLHGQQDVIRSAIADSGLPASSISYVEAHGTATPIGDPLEWEALRLAYAAEGVTDEGRCLVGSIKGNMGHTTSSAGVLGLIKTSLALHYQKLPGTMHFESLNPEITAGPFYVQKKNKDWPRTESPRRAGISSFGVGGTNAHVVIEEAPALPPEHDFTGLQIIALSHQTDDGLGRSRKAAAAYLKASPDSLSAIAKAYNVGRKQFKQRSALIVNANREVVNQLSGSLNQASLVWVFPGQGSQLWGMGAELYQDDAEFRLVWDELSEKILAIGGVDLKKVYWQSEKQVIRNTKESQLGLFAIGYALGKSLLNRGIKPDLMLGHSVGEWVAASLSGIWKLPDVIRILSLRGSLMAELPKGAMLSVRSDLARALQYKPDDVDLAAANGAMQQVFSGPEDSITAFAETLEKAQIVSRRLEANHAFHSWMVEPVCAALAIELKKIEWQPMTIPMLSTVHGGELKIDEAHSPEYWAQHARVPVRFQAAIQSAARLGDIILCEMGPRLVTSNLSRKELSKASVICPALGDDNEHLHFANLLAQLWIAGRIESESLQNSFTMARASGLAYIFQSGSAWVEALKPEAKIDTVPLPLPLVTKPTPIPTSTSTQGETNMRVNEINEAIRALVEESSGELIEAKDDATHFTELGLDSLFLTQLSLQLRNKFKVEISFRQLMEELSSLKDIAHFIDSKLPSVPAPAQAASHGGAADPAPAPTPHVQAQAMFAQPLAMFAQPLAMMGAAPMSGLNGLFSQQLQVIQQQLALLSGQPLTFASAPASGPTDFQVAPTSTTSVAQVPAAASSPSAPASVTKTSTIAVDPTDEDQSKRVFGAMAKISKVSDKLGPIQKASIEAFQKAYNEKTKSSKQRTQDARKMMADPRVVTGFKPVLKEMIYPILVNRSKGSEIWDVDGNRYIDMLNGFGSNFFGYSPDFIIKAMKEQLDTGYELGPQHPLALEASALATELTGHDRVAWCNTGSEAVLGAMRIARTVTGRTKIASFTGSYHGINDEVIIRGTKQLRPLAAAPGIMPAAVQNMLVLDYGTDEALAILREQCKDLAAILVEPAQSRRPEFRPLEFLKELRQITKENGTVLIFDEVITGFRYHPAGFQGAMGIEADVSTYGKVVGGGMPIGMIGGKREFMDALDGGHWNFGDQSIPEVGVTYFAGTFVRHPLTLSAAVAAMKRMKEMGPALQDGINRKADRFCADLNQVFRRMDAPFHYANFGSLMKLKITDESRGYPELLACWLRNKGVHIWDGFPTFITCSHTDEQLSWVVEQFVDAIREMQTGGLLGEITKAQTAQYFTDFGMKVAPNHPQAKLGVDEMGQAAWFIPDPDRPGKFKQLIVE